MGSMDLKKHEWITGFNWMQHASIGVDDVLACQNMWFLMR